MMVVPVFMTSYQVSLYWKNGPEIAQTASVPIARAKAAGRPAARLVALAKRVKTHVVREGGGELLMIEQY